MQQLQQQVQQQQEQPQRDQQMAPAFQQQAAANHNNIRTYIATRNHGNMQQSQVFSEVLICFSKIFIYYCMLITCVHF